MDRDNEILLHEPERIAAQASLSTESRAHLKLHLVLEKSGQQWNEKSSALSGDFDERLLKALDQSATFAVNESDFAPLPAPGEGGLSYKKLLQLSAAVMIFIGIGFISFRYSEQKQTIPAVEKSGSTPTGVADSPADSTARQEAKPLPATVNRGQAEENEARDGNKESLSAPAPAAARERTAWDEDSADPERKLHSRIAAEKDPATKRILQQRLLELYISTGQTEKAESLRQQMR